MKDVAICMPLLFALRKILLSKSTLHRLCIHLKRRRSCFHPIFGCRFSDSFSDLCMKNKYYAISAMNFCLFCYFWLWKQIILFFQAHTSSCLTTIQLIISSLPHWPVIHCHEEQNHHTIIVNSKFRDKMCHFVVQFDILCLAFSILFLQLEYCNSMIYVGQAIVVDIDTRAGGRLCTKRLFFLHNFDFNFCFVLIFASWPVNSSVVIRIGMTGWMCASFASTFSSIFRIGMIHRGCCWIRLDYI